MLKKSEKISNIPRQSRRPRLDRSLMVIWWSEAGHHEEDNAATSGFLETDFWSVDLHKRNQFLSILNALMLYKITRQDFLEQGSDTMSFPQLQDTNEREFLRKLLCIVVCSLGETTTNI